MDGQRAVAMVIDKAELPELVHEMTDPRSGGADHLRQLFLIEGGKLRLGSTIFASIRQHQQNAGQALFREIEESVHEIFFHPDHPGKQIGDKELGKAGIFMDKSNQRSLFHAGDRG